MEQRGPASDADAEQATTRSDEVLWARLGAADPDALTELFNRHSTAVYNFAFRRTASWPNAKDVTQATFVALWRRAAAGDLPSLENSTALPWLLGVADRESRGLYRTLVRRGRLQQRLESVTAHDQHVPDHGDLVAQQLDDERRMARVRDAVRVLPAHQRVVIELVVWSGLSITETASTLAIPAGTVKSRLARARHRLGASLSPHHPTASPLTAATSEN